MICQWKIDDRLIHGMVYMNWFPHFKINRAIIVDDVICKDETRKMALKLGMPASAKLVIWSVDQAAEKLKAGVDQGSNVMIICNSPVWMKKLCEKGIAIDDINLGNLSNNGKDSVQVSGTVWADPEQLEAFKWLAAKGVKLSKQNAPTEKVIEVGPIVATL